MTDRNLALPTSPAERRAHVVALRLEGRSQMAIARETGYTQATVSRIIAQYEGEMLRNTVPAARDLSGVDLVAATRIVSALGPVRTVENKRRVVNAVLRSLDGLTD